MRGGGDDDSPLQFMKQSLLNKGEEDKASSLFSDYLNDFINHLAVDEMSLDSHCTKTCSDLLAVMTPSLPSIVRLNLEIL